jgi:hypothetical protein
MEGQYIGQIETNFNCVCYLKLCGNIWHLDFEGKVCIDSLFPIQIIKNQKQTENSEIIQQFG